MDPFITYNIKYSTILIENGYQEKLVEHNLAEHNWDYWSSVTNKIIYLRRNSIEYFSYNPRIYFTL